MILTHFGACINPFCKTHYILIFVTTCITQFCNRYYNLLIARFCLLIARKDFLFGHNVKQFTSPCFTQIKWARKESWHNQQILQKPQWSSEGFMHLEKKVGWYEKGETEREGSRKFMQTIGNVSVRRKREETTEQWIKRGDACWNGKGGQDGVILLLWAWANLAGG